MREGTLDPAALLAGLVLDDGRRWGEVAAGWQRDDAVAVLDVDGPRLHFQTRPRGGSKTTDLAAVSTVALLTQAPARSRSYAYAADREQAGLLLDGLAGLVDRTPGLAGALTVETWRATVNATGATLAVQSSDDASAFGRLPWFVIVDEVAQWPSTRKPRRLWEAIVSGLPKVEGSRLVVLTTAGDPAHWSHRVLAEARGSSRWRVSEVPGPLPWADQGDLDEQRRLLPESVFARLHLNRWTAAEDRLVDPDDLAACVTLDGPQDPRPGVGYRIGLDLGLKHDRTVLAVCHAERDPVGGLAPPRVVLDRMHVLAGSRGRPVSLGDVERVAYEAHRAYNGASIRLDPWQAVGLAQRLRARGVRVEEWTFSATSVGRLATSLHLLLRDRRLALPDDPDLLDELANVRLRETSPGVVRLDHDASHHDDRAVALGLVALALTERGVGGASVHVPHGTIVRDGSAPAVPGRLAISRRSVRRSGEPDRSGRQPARVAFGGGPVDVEGLARDAGLDPSKFRTGDGR